MCGLDRAGRLRCSRPGPVDGLRMRREASSTHDGFCCVVAGGLLPFAVNGGRAAVRPRTLPEIRATRRRRSHSCWGHLVAAPLWPLYGANLGTLLRTCDAVGACLAVPRLPWVPEALARATLCGGARVCITPAIPCAGWGANARQAPMSWAWSWPTKRSALAGGSRFTRYCAVGASRSDCAEHGGVHVPLRDGDQARLNHVEAFEEPADLFRAAIVVGDGPVSAYATSASSLVLSVFTPS